MDHLIVPKRTPAAPAVAVDAVAGHPIWLAAALEGASGQRKKKRIASTPTKPSSQKCWPPWRNALRRGVGSNSAGRVSFVGWALPTLRG